METIICMKKSVNVNPNTKKKGEYNQYLVGEFISIKPRNENIKTT